MELTITKNWSLYAKTLKALSIISMPHKMGKKIKVVFGLEEWKGKCDEKLKGENAMVEFWDDVMERKDRRSRNLRSCKDAIFRVLESKRIITHNRNYCRIAFFWFF
jgi:hypothetical protein